MRCSCLFLVAFVLCATTTDLAVGDVRVRGHVRSNGKYVAPHYRSNADGLFSNNWSTWGNVNPYTGKLGTKKRPNTTSPNRGYYAPSSSLSGHNSLFYGVQPSIPANIESNDAYADLERQRTDRILAETARLSAEQAAWNELYEKAKEAGEQEIRLAARQRREEFEKAQDARLVDLRNSLKIEAKKSLKEKLAHVQQRKEASEKAIRENARSTFANFVASIQRDKKLKLDSFDERRGNIEATRQKVRESYSHEAVARMESRWKRDDAWWNAQKEVGVRKFNESKDHELIAFRDEIRIKASQQLLALDEHCDSEIKTWHANLVAKLSDVLAYEGNRLEREFATSESIILAESYAELETKLAELRIKQSGQLVERHSTPQFSQPASIELNPASAAILDVRRSHIGTFSLMAGLTMAVAIGVARFRTKSDREKLQPSEVVT